MPLLNRKLFAPKTFSNFAVFSQWGAHNEVSREEQDAAMHWVKGGKFSPKMQKKMFFCSEAHTMW